MSTVYRKQEQEPAGTDVTEVAPGILRSQLPIQMPGLGHVNMYMLLDDQGVAVVDPGLPGPFTWRAITDRLGSAGLKVRDVHTVLVTHAHPDHYGSAGRLAREAGANLIAHAAFPDWWDHESSPAGERHAHLDVTGAAELAEAGDAEDEPAPGNIGSIDDVASAAALAVMPPTGNPFDEPVPWGGARMRPPFRARLMRRAGQLGFKHLFVAPRPSHRAIDGEVLHLAGREWHVVHTPGHTLDHLCLYDPRHNVMLSGDHVLPTITPHISGIGTGPDPLRAFIASLDKVLHYDDVQTVLPAHGHPFTDLAGRVEAIKRHHVERCDKLREVSSAIGPATVEELSHHLFRKERWGGAAESETYAHLEHMRNLGQVSCAQRNGKLVYTVST
jgi:glyoxylase-like metal-dependent hydrolase (beta-lactamase superfamily II)